MSTEQLSETVSFVKCIDRGIKLLDQLYPGWIHDVDLATLDLHDSTKCVLGQVATARSQHDDGDPSRHYDRAVRHIVAAGLAEHESDAQLRHGFALPPLTFVGWGLATAMWREAITALRAQRRAALILAA